MATSPAYYLAVPIEQSQIYIQHSSRDSKASRVVQISEHAKYPLRLLDQILVAQYTGVHAAAVQRKILLALPRTKASE